MQLEKMSQQLDLPPFYVTTVNTSRYTVLLKSSVWKSEVGRLDSTCNMLGNRATLVSFITRQHLVTRNWRTIQLKGPLTGFFWDLNCISQAVESSGKASKWNFEWRLFGEVTFLPEQLKLQTERTEAGRLVCVCSCYWWCGHMMQFVLLLTVTSAGSSAHSSPAYFFSGFWLGWKRHFDFRRRPKLQDRVGSRWRFVEMTADGRDARQTPRHN